jgi:hypothetical protein
LIKQEQDAEPVARKPVPAEDPQSDESGLQEERDDPSIASGMNIHRATSYQTP